MNKKIVLASASPRREELLRELGLEFIVYPPSIEEINEENCSPKDIVLKNAIKKAEAVASNFSNAVIISADTIVVLEGKVIGKPKDRDDAIRILEKLKGKKHFVFTAVVVWETPENRYFCKVAKSMVKMREYTREEIEKYVDTGEPLDKAGAYGIQGKGALFVEKIEGDYYNIVGLPIGYLYLLLKRVGINIL